MAPFDAARHVARLALVLTALASASTLGAQGALRELTCRGKPGIALRVDQDPSPRDTSMVVMVLEYTRSTAVLRDSVKRLAPGACTWNSYQSPGVPVEPGRVRFEVKREAQPWSAAGPRNIDTTLRGGRYFPDPITMPRYLGDSTKYWKFFVNDVTGVVISMGAWLDEGLPTYVRISGPLALAKYVKRDLLCRGGPSGLLFGGGTNAGDNRARVVLGYRVSAATPGPAGGGLSPGTCAWTDRTAIPKEPGRIVFFTARNAQIKQAQSGSIDRTPTAAERYPDVFTIPRYLEDPQHYWIFGVMSGTPDSALTNGPWKRDLTSVVATDRSTATPTRVSLPGISSGSGAGVYRSDGGGSTANVTAVYDIKNVIVSPTLDNLIIGFQAAPNIAPVVTVTPAAGGAPVAVPVQGSAQGTLWRYVGSANAPLARNTQYTWKIDAPESAVARANTKSGTFKTLSQRATISVSQIYLISDGDKEGNGELKFDFDVCPFVIQGYLLTAGEGEYLNWGDGPHPTNVELQSTAEVPDRFQLRVMGTEDDRETLSTNLRRLEPTMSCGKPLPDTGRNLDGEWNTLAVDFDLSKYPGAKAGDSFVKRSRLPATGGSLMFEVRGSFQVTRQ